MIMNRPLSPHLTIYKPQITSMLSILHRLTGAALSFSFFIFATWIILITVGKSMYPTLDCFFSNPIVQLILIAVSVAYFYHLCTGIRHIFWDFGVGLELKTVHITGWIVLVATALITALFWLSII